MVWLRLMIRVPKTRKNAAITAQVPSSRTKKGGQRATGHSDVAFTMKQYVQTDLEVHAR